MIEGIVVSNRYSIFQVESDGVIYNVTSKGSLKLTSKVLVGDHVTIDDSFSVITKISPRINELKRPLISNINHLFIVQSIKQPEFSYLLVFKYLTYANMHNIKASVVVTKCDLEDDKENIKTIKEVFDKIGVDIYFISSKTRQGIDELSPLFVNNISCLLGQTGAGKSSLINAIEPGFEREIGEYSKFLNRGKHKTKEVVLLPFHNGYIADTPGFSSLELDLNKKQLAQFYLPFKDLPLECYYSNCLHVTENRCKVKEAINNGDIPSICYDVYLKLLEEATN